MPDRAKARSTSSLRVGVGDSGTGDPAGAGARFDLDFSGCMALSWPGNTGLEQMLLAADLSGNQVPARPARTHSADEGSPDAAAEEDVPKTAEAATEESSLKTTEAATEESRPKTTEAATEKSGPKCLFLNRAGAAVAGRPGGCDRWLTGGAVPGGYEGGA